jgi:hypothetical protein
MEAIPKEVSGNFTAAICSTFQIQTGWIFLYRRRSGPEQQPM